VSSYSSKLTYLVPVVKSRKIAEIPQVEVLEVKVLGVNILNHFLTTRESDQVIAEIEDLVLNATVTEIFVDQIGLEVFDLLDQTPSLAPVAFALILVHFPSLVESET
jgi:transcriptional regulator NrdR family protein